jgi:FMN phosphatase YigB (HAD superfamily)
VPLLLIDLDNTLIDRTACFVGWAQGFVAEHGLPAEALAWLEEADGDGYVPRPEFLGAVRERFALAAELDELTAGYAHDYAENTVAPGAEAIVRLTRLRERGWKVGLVTNGSPRQARKVEVAALGPLLDAVCISDVEGVAKPDERFFRIAAERCGLPLDGAWMAGDNPEADIAGAARLGLQTIWLRRGRDWPLADVEPTHAVDRLDEAFDLLLAL